MNKKTIIFDFDGTIADSFQLTVEICKKLADEFNFKKIGPEDIDPWTFAAGCRWCRSCRKRAHIGLKRAPETGREGFPFGAKRLRIHRL